MKKGNNKKTAKNLDNLLVSLKGEIEKIEDSFSSFFVSKINGVDVSNEGIVYLIENNKLTKINGQWEGAPIDINFYRRKNDGQNYTEIILSKRKPIWATEDPKMKKLFDRH